MTPARNIALRFYSNDENIKKTIDKLVGQVNLKLEGNNNHLNVIINLADISIKRTLLKK